jgi:hypothetical protein
MGSSADSTTAASVGPMTRPIEAAQSSAGPQGASTAKKTRLPRSPAVFGDCANDAWRNYSDPAFKSQKACERWVDKHVLASTTFSTPASKASDRHPARTPPRG